MNKQTQCGSKDDSMGKLNHHFQVSGFRFQVLVHSNSVVMILSRCAVAAPVENNPVNLNLI